MIGLAIGIVFFGILSGLTLFNASMSRRIWSGFNRNLLQLNAFRIEKPESVALVDTRISEFNALFSTLDQLITRAQRDYVSLREFTEHASHELQTPLAIIQTKMEMLIQSPGLDRKRADLIQSVNGAIRRLQSLYQSLLLLTKIEDNQFREVTDVRFSDLVNRLIESFREMVASKGIRLSVRVDDGITIRGSR